MKDKILDKAASYATSDLFLAAFLTAGEYSKLANIRDTGNGRKEFVFEPAPSEALILGFYNGTERLPAIRLFEAYNSLKSYTYLKRP